MINVCTKCDKPVYFRRKDKRTQELKEWRCYSCNSWIREPNERPRSTGWNTDRKRKTYIEDRDLITKEQLIQKLDTLNGSVQSKVLMYKALISFLYVTASRVEEVVGLVKRRPGATKEERRVMIKGAEALRINQVSFENHNGEDFMVVNNIPTLKRKLKGKNAYGEEINRIPTRTIGVLVKDDKVFIDYIKSYIDTLAEKNPFLPLFKMTYQRAWQISNMVEISLEKNAFNHYWRHLRLTHLASKYGFTDMQLQQYVGWANTNMASKYVHLNWKNLGDLMIYGSKKNL